jgi:hypothetical protein
MPIPFSLPGKSVEDFLESMLPSCQTVKSEKRKRAAPYPTSGFCEDLIGRGSEAEEFGEIERGQRALIAGTPVQKQLSDVRWISCLHAPPGAVLGRLPQPAIGAPLWDESRIATLTNFGIVTFNQCNATGSDGVATPIWDHPNVAVNMASGSTLKATVSPLSDDGTSFTAQTFSHVGDG